MNVPGILETLKTTEDDKQRNKLLTSLIAILPSQVTCERDVIVTFSIVYETAHSILRRGTQGGKRSVLSFLTALLRTVTRTEAPARASAARELLRRSGCLQDMLDLFLGTEVMNNESLKVLCECLVESCKDCENNQNYCNRLIPACLQRYDANNNEILKLLHRLLLNNTRNINMFVECNGISTIFTRDSIQDSSRMELLSIVVQNSMAANVLKRDTDLVKFLFTVDENHKMVEWASVILFHIASQMEDNPGQESRNIMEIENEVESSLCDVSVSFLLKPNWDKIQPTTALKSNKTGNSKREYILQKSAAALKKSCVEALRGDQISLHSSVNSLVTENLYFKPKFVSTPKRKLEAAKFNDKSKVAESSKERKNRKEQKSNNGLQRKLYGNNSALVVKKKLSASARLFNIVNNSCVSIYNMMGNVFFRSAPNKWRREDLLKPNSNIEVETPKCRFNNYMKRRDFLHTSSKSSVHVSCQKSLKQKFGINKKYYKGIIKKLKSGINFYGCDFKKIAQAMWSQEKQMTAQVLYSIYRKFIVK